MATPGVYPLLFEEIRCQVCLSGKDGEYMLLCDGADVKCPGAAHIYCCDPPLSQVPDGEWFCDVCKAVRAEPHVNADRCFACGTDKGQTLLCCDTCVASFHLKCVSLHRVPEGMWKCPICTGEHTHDYYREKRKQRPITRSVSELIDTEMSDEWVDVRQCAFCKRFESDVSSGSIVDDDLEFCGPYYVDNGPVQWAHRVCALWSPQVYVKGNKLMNVEIEIERSRYQHCAGKCGKRGASLGCLIPSCLNSYHFHCAKLVMCEFYRPPDYRILCPEHAITHILRSKFNIELPPPVKKSRTQRRRLDTRLAQMSEEEKKELKKRMLEDRPFVSAAEQWQIFIDTDASSSSSALGLSTSKVSKQRKQKRKEFDRFGLDTEQLPEDPRKQRAHRQTEGLGYEEKSFKALLGDFESRTDLRKDLHLAKKDRRKLLKLRARVQSTEYVLHKTPAKEEAVAAASEEEEEEEDKERAKMMRDDPWKLVGGLEQEIKALKEAVILPLLYPELFASLNIRPPRGVLLYGPPGTGKTLLARMLACCTHRSITFFARKGADLLSKFYGETESHIRVLFQKARERRPSMIFFDEIDALCPVRSPKQNQVHSSIVSTLLALMDGLDDRGDVFIIAATNRPDSIDPALRRPGRFDRELYIPLPGENQRAQILNIYTKNWQLPLGVIHTVAAQTPGFSGADLKGLCSETVLRCARDRIPNLFHTEVKREEVTKCIAELKVSLSDFQHSIIAKSSHGSPLSPSLSPLLTPYLTIIIQKIRSHFSDSRSSDGFIKRDSGFGCLRMGVRLMIEGLSGMGQEELLKAAEFTCLEGCSVRDLSIPALIADHDASSLPEALCRAFYEQRSVDGSGSRGVVYVLPFLDTWWEHAEDVLRATLVCRLSDLKTVGGPLILSSSSRPWTAALSYELQIHPSVFSFFSRNMLRLKPPTKEAKRAFWVHSAQVIGACTNEELSSEEVESLVVNTPNWKIADFEICHHQIMKENLLPRDLCSTCSSDSLTTSSSDVILSSKVDSLSLAMPTAEPAASQTSDFIALDRPTQVSKLSTYQRLIRVVGNHDAQLGTRIITLSGDNE